MQIGKEEIKIFLFADDIDYAVENLNQQQQKILNLISKVAGYKVNII